MKHPLKKLASAVLATALLASCMSVGFLASAAGSYVFTDKFGDNKFPKAVSVFVQGGGATDKCYGFTTMCIRDRVYSTSSFTPSIGTDTSR